MQKIIIGITGTAGTGKDTVADYLVKGYKFNKAGFSDPLKYVCAELFLENPKDFFTQKGKEVVMPHWGITRRAALQFVGTELVRNRIWELTNPQIGVDIALTKAEITRLKNAHWIHCMIKRIQDFDFKRVVINDLRFQNEADWIYDSNGWVIHVTSKRSNGPVVGGIAGHSSEEGFNFIGDKTWLITNDGTFESLYQQIDTFMDVNKIIPVIS